MSSDSSNTTELNGADYLAQISSGVELLQYWMPKLPELARQAKKRESEVAMIGNTAIADFFMRQGEISEIPGLVADANEAIGTLSVERDVVKGLIAHTMSLRQGRKLGVEDSWAHLLVVKPGVGLETRVIEEDHAVNIRLRKKLSLPLGAVYLGKIQQFSTEPEAGGNLIISRWSGFLTTTLRGLVDPDNGESRVELQILKSNTRTK